MLYAGTRLILGVPVESTAGFSVSDVCEIWSPSRNRRVGGFLMVSSIESSGGGTPTPEHDLIGIELRPSATTVNVGDTVDVEVLIVREPTGAGPSIYGNAMLAMDLFFNWNPLDLRLVGINTTDNASQLISSRFPPPAQDFTGINEVVPPADGTGYYVALAIGSNPVPAMLSGTKVTSFRFEVLRAFETTQITPIASVPIPGSTSQAITRVLDSGAPGYDSTGTLRGATIAQGTAVPPPPPVTLPAGSSGVINVTLTSDPKANDFIAEGDVFRKVTDTSVVSEISGPFQSFTDNLNQVRSGRGFIEPFYNPQRHDLYSFNSDGTVASQSPLNLGCLAGTEYTPNSFDYTGLVFTARTNAPRGHWNGLGSRVGALLTRQHIWICHHYPLENDSISACSGTQIHTRAKRGKWEQPISGGAQYQSGNGYMHINQYPAWYLSKTGRSVEIDYPDIPGSVWNTFSDFAIQAFKTPFPESVNPCLLAVTRNPTNHFPDDTPMVIVNNSWLTASLTRGRTFAGSSVVTTQTLNTPWSNLPAGASLNDMASVVWFGDSGSVVLCKHAQGTLCLGMANSGGTAWGITVSSSGVYQSCSSPPFSGVGSCQFDDRSCSSTFTTGTSVFTPEQQRAINLVLADTTWQVTPESMLSPNSEKNITTADIIHTDPNWLLLDGDPSSPPPTSQSALDYDVWAFGFFSEAQNGQLGMFSTSAPPALAWNTPTFSLHSLVPMVGIGSNEYNGYRPPGATDVPTSSGPGLSVLTNQKFVFPTFKQRMETIPPGRRAINPYYWWPDISIFTKRHYNYYKDTADGTLYERDGRGDRVLTVWQDVNAEDCANSVRGFLQTCLNTSPPLIFDFICDDKEAQDIFWLNGRNISNYWLPDANGDGYPDEPPNHPPHRSQMPDARFASAIAADPRFTQKINPATNMTFAQEFVENYKALANRPDETRTWQQILAPFINATGPMNYADARRWWTPWGCVGGCLPEGRTTLEAQELGIDGFDAWHYVIPAWNATADAWHFNYYIDTAVLKVLKEFPEYQHVGFSQYEIHAISAAESYTHLRSNAERALQKPVAEWYVGGSVDYYGDAQNILYIGGWSFMPRSTLPYEAPPETASFLPSFRVRTGYVNNPQTDLEKYSWNGWYVETYRGPAGNQNLVRYPETNPYPNGTYSATEARKFFKELCYKFFVKGVMRTRLSLRSDPTSWQRFAPWISDPDYYNSPYVRVLSQIDKGYWYEMVYHLCVSGVRFFNYYADTYTNSAVAVHQALEVWRNVSFNSRTIPCSNQSGAIDAPVDRVLMHDAFNRLLISGGKLEKSGQYIWRITIPPKFFNAEGVCVLRRTDSSTDLPEFITVGSSDVKNAFGTWIVRNNPTPPAYTLDTGSVIALVVLEADSVSQSSSVTGVMDVFKASLAVPAGVQNKLKVRGDFDGTVVLELNPVEPTLNADCELASEVQLAPADIPCKLRMTAELGIPATAELAFNPIQCRLRAFGQMTITKFEEGFVLNTFFNTDNISTVELTASDNSDTFLKNKNLTGYDSAITGASREPALDVSKLGLVPTVTRSRV